MIRLIASDLDGTLLQNGAQGLSDEALQLVRRVKELGIHFVAASGRQYPNMKRLFGPVWEDMIFVAENGSLIVQSDEILDKVVIPRPLAVELIQELYRHDCCDVVVSGVHSIYLQPKEKTRPYMDFLIYNTKNTTTVVDNLCEFNEEIIKISALVYDDGVINFGDIMKPTWSRHFHVAVAGREWLDFTPSNKGEAMEKLRDRLGLERHEMVAFGDNFNDETLFQSVRNSYAMSGARDEVRKMARHCCDSVENVLRNIIAYVEAN